MNTHKPRTKEEAHEEAASGDLQKQYRIGQSLDLIVIKSPSENNGREAYARHNDVSVFIYPGRLSLHSGTRVRVKVSEIGETHLKAVALAALS